MVARLTHLLNALVVSAAHNGKSLDTIALYKQIPVLRMIYKDGIFCSHDNNRQKLLCKLGKIALYLHLSNSNLIWQLFCTFLFCFVFLRLTLTQIIQGYDPLWLDWVMHNCFFLFVFLKEWFSNFSHQVLSHKIHLTFQVPTGLDPDQIRTKSGLK